MFLWLVFLGLGVVVLLHTTPPGYTLSDVVFEVASAQGNVGLSVGITHPGMPLLSKLALCFNMWIGRLEIIPVLMLVRSLFLALGYDRSEFLFLDEITVGMTGIGKTVVAGDTISEFAVEVLGVIDQPGDLSDFIVVRVSGEAIGRSGGIAQGMSGSPIYIDGKLIGALSRAAAWSKAIRSGSSPRSR